MGFPVYPHLASVARIRQVVAKKAIVANRNAMHVANVGVVMLAAMFASDWFPEQVGEDGAGRAGEGEGAVARGGHHADM